MSSVTSTSSDEYTIRPYEPVDKEAVLALYSETFGDRSGEWFDWRYVDNPFLQEVPIVVAERKGRRANDGGEVVAARPSLPVPLSVGGEPELAIMQVDPMVHPDHRRQGLFSRMVTHVHERYATRDPTVSIGFPNGQVREALEKLGSELSLHAGIDVEFQEYTRVQNPAAVAREATDGGIYSALGRAAAPAVSGYLTLRDRLAEDSDELQVDRIEGAPAEQLAALAAERSVAAAHAHRCSEFYRWRFANPRVDYTTYVAHGDWGPVAALVLGRRSDRPAAGAIVSEVVPLDGGEEWADAVSTLLGAAVADAGDADVVSAAGSVVARQALGAHGFRADGAFPFSLVASRTYLVARPIVDHEVGEWVVNGTRLSEPSGWRFSNCERELG